MIVAKHNENGTILVLADDRGLKKPMFYNPEKGWGVGIVTADELMDDYHNVTDEVEREKLFQEAKNALDMIK